MIQIFHFDTPVGERETDPLIATLSARLQRLLLLYPALRGVALTASGGVLRMSLRCSGTDRWKTQGAARQIATVMLRRAKLDPATTVLALVEPVANARSLTKETGRNPNHTPRGAKRRAANRAASRNDT